MLAWCFRGPWGDSISTVEVQNQDFRVDSRCSCRSRPAVGALKAQYIAESAGRELQPLHIVLDKHSLLNQKRIRKAAFYVQNISTPNVPPDHPGPQTASPAPTYRSRWTHHCEAGWGCRSRPRALPKAGPAAFDELAACPPHGLWDGALGVSWNHGLTNENRFLLVLWKHARQNGIFLRLGCDRH